MFGLFKEIKKTMVSTNPDDPDGPFNWARAVGYEVHQKWTDCHKMSLGDSTSWRVSSDTRYDGTDGPSGFCTRDAQILDEYIAECRRRGEDVGGWIVEGVNGDEWERTLSGEWER